MREPPNDVTWIQGQRHPSLLTRIVPAVALDGQALWYRGVGRWHCVDLAQLRSVRWGASAGGTWWTLRDQHGSVARLPYTCYRDRRLRRVLAPALEGVLHDSKVRVSWAARQHLRDWGLTLM